MERGVDMNESITTELTSAITRFRTSIKYELDIPENNIERIVRMLAFGLGAEDSKVRIDEFIDIELLIPYDLDNYQVIKEKLIELYYHNLYPVLYEIER